MNCQIKPCHLSDLPEVWEIVNSCSEWLASQGMNHWKDYYTPEVVKNKIDNTSVFGLFSEHILKGVVSLSVKKPEYYAQEDIQKPDANALYLGMLAVKPEYQREGLGSRLMTFSEEIARTENKKVIRLMYFTTHEKLGQFYSKHGYEVIRTRDDEGDLMSFCEKKI